MKESTAQNKLELYQGIVEREQDNYDEIWKKILANGDYPFYTGETTIESVQNGNWHWVYKRVTEDVTEEVTYQTNNKGTTISGGTGDGNDSIFGFNAASTLKIGDGTSTYSSQVSGDDRIVTIGDGKITLVGAANLSKVNILGKNKTPSTLLTITDSTQSPVTVDSVIKKINASKRTTAVKITGNAVANTISGGAGNDSLNGGDSIALKDFTASTFHINKDTYAISGSELVKK